MKSPLNSPEKPWLSEKAISIGHYFVVSGVYTVFGGMLLTTGAPVFQNHIFKEYEDKYGGMWDMIEDPIEHAHSIIAHIDNKHKALGIDKARDRVMMDFAARQAL